MDLLAGGKEMLKIDEQEKELLALTKAEEAEKEIILKQKAEKISQIENEAFLQPEILELEIKDKKPKKEKRGISKKTQEELSQHMEKMREKAKEKARLKREEKEKLKEELEKSQMAKKLKIPYETLIEFEEKRKNYSEKKKEEPKQEVDYDKITSTIYNKMLARFEETEKQEKLKKQKEEENNRLMVEANKKYYSKLGKSKSININDPWLNLFKK